MAKARDKLKIEARQRIVLRLLLQKYTSQQIVDKINEEHGTQFSKSTIDRDIAACKEEWRKEFSDDRDQLVKNELANLQNIENVIHVSLAQQTDPAAIAALTARLSTIAVQRSKLLGLEVSPAKNRADEPDSTGSREPIGLRIEIIQPGNRAEVTADEDGGEEDLDDGIGDDDE